MHKLIESKILVLLAFTALLTAFSYAFSIMDEPRMAEGALELNEASIIEIIIIMLAPIAAITMWVLALAHSFKYGRKAWGVITIFVWPVAFVYAFMVNYVWDINNAPHHR